METDPCWDLKHEFRPLFDRRRQLIKLAALSNLLEYELLVLLWHFGISRKQSVKSLTRNGFR